MSCWWHVLLLMANVLVVSAKVSDYEYDPNGDSPVLYRPGIDKVINLDAETFGETVFGSSTPFLVEVYKDWCGHCRKFLPTYRSFARSIYNWNEVVKVAALNCADVHNKDICSSALSYGKKTVPTMKFFPANSKDFSDAHEFDPERKVEDMRHLMVENLNDCCGLSGTLSNNFTVSEIQDKIEGSNNPFNETWNVLPESVQYVVFVFEDDDGNGTVIGQETTLDMLPYKEKLQVVSMKSESNLAQSLGVTTFPHLFLFKRGSDGALFNTDAIHSNTSGEVIEHTDLEPFGSHAVDKAELEAKPKVTNCTEEPESCKKLYYVSERDMLKAMRIALYNEIVGKDVVEGEAFDALRNFVGLFAEYFPTETRKDAPRRSAKTPLKNSQNAHELFKDLYNFLSEDSRKNERKLTTDEWNTTFLESEEKYDHPFPDKNAEWEHCHGSSVEYRGFTCGLWSSFHTMTINYFLNKENAEDNSETALVPLKGIQKWVKAFFSCEVCRKHFMKMTTEEFPMDESQVKNKADSYLYLWRAHNRVNDHLHGEPTEDPQFTKYQFPPSFLCEDCKDGDGEEFKVDNVKEFLIGYYTNIKPHH
jgi:thiol oxidase